MFKIETKLERLHKDTIAQHRRLVTPFFYKSLKPRIYKRYSRKPCFLPLPFGGSTPIPESIRPTIQGWELQTKSPLDAKPVVDDSFERELDIANDQLRNNLLKISA